MGNFILFEWKSAFLEHWNPQIKGPLCPILKNYTIFFIRKSITMQWNNSFSNLETSTNRFIRVPPLIWRKNRQKLTSNGLTGLVLRVQTWHHVFFRCPNVPKHHTTKIKMLPQSSHLTHSPTGQEGMSTTMEVVCLYVRMYEIVWVSDFLSNVRTLPRIHVLNI